MPLEAEAVKQRLLHHPPLAHHRVSLRFAMKIESAASQRGKRLFRRNSIHFCRSARSAEPISIA
jgi:hypothetical protein